MDLNIRKMTNHPPSPVTNNLTSETKKRIKKRYTSVKKNLFKCGNKKHNNSLILDEGYNTRVNN